MSYRFILGLAALLSTGIASAVMARTIEVPRCATGNCPNGVNEYSTIDSALIAAQDGDRIHISAGTYTAPSGGWQITKSIEFYGDGSGDKAGGTTRLKAAGTPPSGPVVVLYPNTVSGSANLEGVYIHDLQIRQDSKPNSLISGQYGITWTQSGTNMIEELRLARLYIANMGDDGINLIGVSNGGSSTYVVSCSIQDVEVMDCLGHGMQLYQCTGTYLLGCYAHRNGLTGCFAAGSEGFRSIASAFEANDLSGQGKPQLQIDSCHGFLVEGCHFEEFDDGGPGAIRLDQDFGGYIGGCIFANASGTNARGIFLSNAGVSPAAPSSDITIGPNAWQRVNTLIEFDDTDSIRACTVMPQSVWSSTGVASKIVVPEAVDRGNIVYPHTSNTSNLTAGIVLPRLSGSKRDAMVAASSGGTRREGLTVYNDAAKALNYYNGSVWTTVPSYFPTKSSSTNAPAGGIAFPLVASTTRDSLPGTFKVEGAVIYNKTTHEFNYWNGSVWRGLSTKNP